MTNELEYNSKYALYLSILDKYKLDFFDELNCNDFFVFISCDYYEDFESVEKLQQIVFDCISELNSHTIEFNDFFITYRIDANTENDCIILTTARKIYEYVRDEMQ